MSYAFEGRYRRTVIPTGMNLHCGVAGMTTSVCSRRRAGHTLLRLAVAFQVGEFSDMVDLHLLRRPAQLTLLGQQPFEQFAPVAEHPRR